MRAGLLGAGLGALLLVGCAPPKPPPALMSEKSPLAMRSIQSRLYDTTDRSKLVRAVIATLQDLGYGIDKVDAGSGTVSATKLAALRLSAAVSPRGETQSAVRANAFVRLPSQQDAQVDSPEFYQQLFFEPLGRTVFLQGQVDNAPLTREPAAPMPGPLPAPAGEAKDAGKAAAAKPAS